jgi:integrase/recombinase XerD
MTMCNGSRTSRITSSAPTAKVEDVRGFQLHLTSSGAGIPKINTTISALRFFFNVTLDRPDLSRHLSTVHKPRKVPVILSPDEMARFLEAAPGIKYKAAFSVAYGAGLRVSEVASLKVDVTYLGGIERGRRNRSLGAVRVEASS